MSENAKKPSIRFDGYMNDWEQRKLGELGELKNGMNFSKDAMGHGFSFVNLQNIFGKNVVNGENLELAEASDKQLKEYNLVEGDVLFVRSSVKLEGVGEAAVVDENLENTTYSGFIIRFRDTYGLDKNYKKFVFSTAEVRNQIMSQATNSANKNISQPVLENLKLFVPSGEEQALIGAYFTNLDNLITLHQRKYEKLMIMKKSMLEKMFPKNGSKVPEIRFNGFTDDWEQRKVGDLVLDHNAGIYISKENYGEGTNVIGVGNIYDNDIFDGEIYRLGPVDDNKFLLDENDIIYGESSLVPEGIARTVCVGKNGAGSAFAWHTRRVKLDNKVINSHFATLELNYLQSVRKYLMSVSTQTALTGMTTEGYFGATLSFPSIDEQARISKTFVEIDHLITLHQRKLEKLNQIKKSMLEKMFV